MSSKSVNLLDGKNVIGDDQIFTNIAVDMAELIARLHEYNKNMARELFVNLPDLESGGRADPFVEIVADHLEVDWDVVIR